MKERESKSNEHCSEQRCESLTKEETLEGISYYLSLLNSSKEQYSLYKEDIENRGQLRLARRNIKEFYDNYYPSLTKCFDSNIFQLTQLDDQKEDVDKLYKYLDAYLRILEEGDEDLWLFAVKRAPEIIENLSNRQNYSDFKFYVRAIYHQLTDIPESLGVYRPKAYAYGYGNSWFDKNVSISIKENIKTFPIWSKGDILFPTMSLIGGYSEEEMFSRNLFDKYPEIVIDGVINFCRSTEQLSLEGEVEESFLYNNLVSKLAFLSNIPWKDNPHVLESVNRSFDNMINISKKRAKDEELKSFEGGARYMSNLFSDVYKNSLRENKEQFPETFLKFSNAIMDDMLRLLEDRVKEGEFGSQTYPRSLFNITKCLLEDVDIFGKEIRKQYDAVIKVRYEGDVFQRYIAGTQLLSNLFLNPIVEDSETRQELYKKGVILCEKGNYQKLEELLREYTEEGDILKVLTLYRSMYFGIKHLLFNSEANPEEIKKIFYNITTV